MDHSVTESQDYQGIGQVAPPAETTFTHQKGWDGIASPVPQAVAPIDQYQSHDYSFWNKRADRQTLAVTDDDNYAADFFVPVNHPDDIAPMAGYGIGDASFHQTPTAATHPVSFPQADPGQIDGADAARDQSGNAGLYYQ